MKDLKVRLNYEQWKDRKITKLSKIMLVPVETDTENINCLIEQIKYCCKDIYDDSTIHNVKVEIINIVSGKLDYFNIEELNELEISL